MILRAALTALGATVVFAGLFASVEVRQPGPWPAPAVSIGDVTAAAEAWLRDCAGRVDADPAGCPQSGRDPNQDRPAPFTWIASGLQLSDEDTSWDAASGQYLVHVRAVMEVRHASGGHVYDGHYVGGVTAGVRQTSDTRAFGRYRWFGSPEREGDFYVLDITPNRFAWTCCRSTDLAS